MKLYIPKVLVHHFGVYACKAKNPRGDTDGIITLSGNIFKYINMNHILNQIDNSRESDRKKVYLRHWPNAILLFYITKYIRVQRKIVR